MPSYDHECRLCGNVTEWEYAMKCDPALIRCPDCGGETQRVILTAPAIRGDVGDFSTENNGKGRFNHQLKCHVRSVQDAVDKAKARGWNVLERNG